MSMPLMAAPAKRIEVTAMALVANTCRVGWTKAKAMPETSM